MSVFEKIYQIDNTHTNVTFDMLVKYCFTPRNNTRTNTNTIT